MNSPTALKGRACVLALILALASIAMILLAGNSSGSPGKWVSLNVDANDISYSWAPRISYDVDSSGGAYATYYYWDYQTQLGGVRFATVRGYDTSSMTLLSTNDSKISVLGSVTRVDSIGRIHLLVETGRFDGVVQGTNLQYYLLRDQQVIETASISALNLSLQFWYWGYAMDVDSSGAAHIAVIDDNDDLYYVTNAGGLWRVEWIGSVGDYGEGVSIAVDGRGAAHVSYVNSTFGYHLVYATNLGGSWTSVSLGAENPFPMSTSIVLDPSGHVFIGCVEWPENTSQGNAGTIEYVSNVTGSFELLKTSFRSDLSGNSNWLSLDSRGYVRVVHDNLVSTAPPLTNSQWVTEAIPGGEYVKEDNYGYLHSFYIGSFDDYLALKYASNKFEDSGPPTDLVSAPLPGGVVISWRSPADSGGLPIQGYQIFCGIEPDKTTLYASVGPNVSSYVFANLSANQMYYFSIAPVTLAGVGSNSSIIGVFPFAAPARNVTNETSADPTPVVVAVTACATGLVSLALVIALKRTKRARMFTVLFTCCALAIISVLPAYVADASLSSEQQTWIETQVANLDWVGCHSLAVDERGRAHIAAAAGYSLGLTYLTNESGPWVSQTVDRSASPFDVSLALDSQGFVYIAYVNNTDAYFDNGPLVFATNRGGDWSVTTIDNTSARACELALGPDGSAHIAYSVEDGRAHLEKYAVLANDSWEIQIIESNSGGPYIWSGDIALNRTGDVRIVYTLEDEVRFACWESGGWNLTTIGRGYSPKIALDANGATNICYTVVDRSSIFYEYSGTYAVQETNGFRLGDMGISSGPSDFAFDSANYLRVLSVQNHYNLVIYEGVYGNLTESSVGNAVLTPMWYARRPSLDLDPSGEPVVSALVGRMSVPSSNGGFVILQRDLSAFTTSERLDKGWAAVQGPVLEAWTVVVVLAGLAFLVTWRLNLWKPRLRTDDSAG